MNMAGKGAKRHVYELSKLLNKKEILSVRSAFMDPGTAAFLLRFGVEALPQATQSFLDLSRGDRAISQRDPGLRGITGGEHRQPLKNNANIHGAPKHRGKLLDRRGSG